MSLLPVFGHVPVMVRILIHEHSWTSTIYILHIVAQQQAYDVCVCPASTIYFQAVFEDMDLDQDGVITGAQLHEGLAKMGAGAISERDVAEFLKVSKVRPPALLVGSMPPGCMWI